MGFLLLALVIFLAVLPLDHFQRIVNPSRAKAKKPNIILFITDDQDVELGSLEFMPKLKEILRGGGAEFTNAFVTTPICCPSRSSLISGLYVHNHGVFSNSENCSSPYWIEQFEKKSFVTALSNAGYRTGYFGKYLNEYNGSYVPAGWREWMGLVKNSKFYNYTVNFNGQKIKHNDVYHEDYFTDLITNDSLAFFKRSRKNHPSRPVMMVLSYPAPHGPEDPAPQYRSWFRNITTHRSPSWNYAPNPDKQWILQRTGKMEPVHVAFTDFLHRRRLQTLQSVDDSLQRVFREVQEFGEEENTFMIYTSDHGYHLGQFGLIKGKNMPYEFDIKVPFFIRGPGVVPSSKIWRPVLNVDVVPTILDMAGLPLPDTLDGLSIVPLLKYEYQLAATGSAAPPEWRHSFLVERGRMRPKMIRRRERIMQQRAMYSKEMRIQKECEKPQYNSPCKPAQQWECRRNEVDRWRIHKCRRSAVKRCFCDPVDTDNGPVRRSKRAPSQFPTAYANRSRDDGSLLLPPHKRLLREFRNEQRNGVILVKGCRLFKHNQTISCKPKVYSNFTAWRERRLHLSKQIRLFRDHIESLKDIRKHLKNERPGNLESTDDEDFLFDADDLNLLLSELSDVTAFDEDYGDFGSSLLATTTARPPQLRLRKGEFRLDDFDWTPDDDVTTVGRKVKKSGRTTTPKTSTTTLPTPTTTSPPQATAAASRQKCRCVNELGEEVPVDDNWNTTGGDGHPLKKPMAHVVDNDYDELDDIDEEILMENLKVTQPRLDKEARRKLRADRMQKKTERLQKRRRIDEKKKSCNIANMNCFTHDNSHWKTPPYWQLGPFCFCQNANNNTYWCMRTVNETHNFLYCEFVTGFLSFYDMIQDPYQLHNIVYSLDIPVLEQLGRELDVLRSCKGARCNPTFLIGQHYPNVSIPAIPERHKGNEEGKFTFEADLIEDSGNLFDDFSFD